MTPTTRSLRYLHDEGWTADVVERRVAGNVVHDLFGFADIVAVRGAETLALQVTSDSGGNVAARCRKVAESAHIGAVREAGWRVEVWGWRVKDGRWILRKVDLS